jgi:hypothetical protein
MPYLLYTSSLPIQLPTHEKHFILLSLSLSRRRGPPLGKALPFDPGPIEGITGLTAEKLSGQFLGLIVMSH